MHFPFVVTTTKKVPCILSVCATWRLFASITYHSDCSPHRHENAAIVFPRTWTGNIIDRPAAVNDEAFKQTDHFAYTLLYCLSSFFFCFDSQCTHPFDGVSLFHWHFCLAIGLCVSARYRHQIRRGNMRI